MDVAKIAITHPASDSVGLDDITSNDVLGQMEVADPQTSEEEVSLGEAWQQVRIASYKQDTHERKVYAHRVFCLISCWLAGVFWLLLLHGFAGTTFFSTFVLSEKVILALIGGTTVNVLGLFYIVTRYLFPNHSAESQTTEHDQNASND